MTVADNTSRNQYTATSGQTVFAYTFEIVDKSHIVVLKNGIALSEGTHFTVSDVGNDNGGNVTLLSGALAGDIMTIYRDMPYSRTQNYTNSGDFLASEVNSDFDDLWLAGEQTDRSFSQSIRKPITDSGSISMELPSASQRAGKYLTFSATGAVTASSATVTGSTSANLVSYIASGSGAVETTVETKLREIASVKDFGAVGDGATDDSTAIQNALNAHNNVTFPPGTYIAKNIDLAANRSVYLQQGAIVKLKSGSTTAEYLFRVNGIDNIRFFGGKIDGNYAGMSGQKPEVIKIQGNNTKNIEIASVHFINPPDRCIGVTVTSGVTIENIRIHDCFFDQSTQGENSFAINNLGRPGTAKRIEVVNNVMNDVVSGIRFWGVDDWTIANNRISCTATTANECIGFHEGASNAKIVGNTLITNSQDPFCITTGTEATTNDIVISDNVMIGPGTTSTNNSDGIEIVIRPGITCERWVIQNNTITGKQHGISLGFDASSAGTSNFNNVVVDGNTVKSISRGIAVIDVGSTTTCTLNDLVISNNVVELTSNSSGANDRCIQVRDNGSNAVVKNAVVEGNIAKNGYWGIYTDAVDGGTNLLVANNISRNNVYGFRLAAATTVDSFKSMGNLSIDNTTADYSYVNFTPQNGCAQINDSDSDGLLASLTTTFAADDTTPSVANSRICFTQANTGATAITQLDDGVAGQEVIICGRSASNATTIADGGNFKLSAAITLTTDTNIHLVTHDGTTWNEVSRSAN